VAAQSNDSPTSSTPSEQRTYSRVQVPIVATIGESDYAVNNLSASGLQVKNLDSQFQIGDCLPLRLILSLKDGIQFSLDVLGEVVWYSHQDAAAGFQFLNLRESEKELLAQFVRNFESGKLTLEDLDIDPARMAGSSAAIAGAESPKSQRRVRFWAITVALALVGAAALTASTVALYRALAFMQIESAAVARSLQAITSTHRGKVTQLYVSEGTTVEAGDPLLRVYDIRTAESLTKERSDNILQLIRDKRGNLERLQQELAQKQARLEEARSGRQNAQLRKQQQAQALQSSRDVTQKKLTQDRQEVASLETQYRAAKAELERMQFLQQQGAVSEARVDRAQSKLAQVEGELQQAREQVKIRKDILSAIAQGRFYDGERFSGDLSELEADVERASAKIARLKREIAADQRAIERQQQQIQTLQRQYRTQDFQLPDSPPASDSSQETTLSQVYDAPMDATVVQLKQTAGERIQIGQSLMVLRPQTERPVVDAFMTQDQAAQIAIGREVQASVPTLDHSYRAKVTSIDRSGGLREEIRRRYQFEGSETRPVNVRLELLNVPERKQRLLEAGTPVELTVRKTDWLGE